MLAELALVDHLVLVLISVAVAIVLGIPMGIVAARHRRAGQLELSAIAMLQTVPALALLMFMIPLFGIGKGPALVALSLYALLPIARNTYAGLMAIDRTLLEIAAVLRLRPARRLLRIELPLAAIAIMAGIKTAAVTRWAPPPGRVHRRRRLRRADRPWLARRHRHHPGGRRPRRSWLVFHAVFELATGGGARVAVGR
jgi:ABC-type proline/glycine betaine transport system permease subunit